MRGTLIIGGVSNKMLVTFTRQFSTLQDAGLPVLRSLKILERQMKPGVLKNSLIDVVDDVESGSTLSEAFGLADSVGLSRVRFTLGLIDGDPHTVDLFHTLSEGYLKGA